MKRYNEDIVKNKILASLLEVFPEKFVYDFPMRTWTCLDNKKIVTIKRWNSEKKEWCVSEKIRPTITDQTLYEIDYRGE